MDTGDPEYSRSGLASDRLQGWAGERGGLAESSFPGRRLSREGLTEPSARRGTFGCACTGGGIAEPTANDMSGMDPRCATGHRGSHRAGSTRLRVALVADQACSACTPGSRRRARLLRGQSFCSGRWPAHLLSRRSVRQRWLPYSARARERTDQRALDQPARVETNVATGEGGYNINARSSGQNRHLFVHRLAP